MADQNAFVLPASDWLPAAEWARATDRQRASYLDRVGELAVARKRQEVRRGIGVDGKRLDPVKPESRPDGATGRPLDPHYGESRTSKWLRKAKGKGHVTVYWSHGWGRILGYHRAGAGRLPVRDTIGLSPAGERHVKASARLYWRNLMGIPAPGQPLAVAGRDFTLAPRDRAEGRVLVAVDTARLDRALAEDRTYYVGPGGVGGSVGKYVGARMFIDSGKPIEAPRLDVDRKDSASLTDGRHRLAALRDSGAKRVAVSVTRGQASKVRRLFGRPGKTVNPPAQTVNSPRVVPAAANRLRVFTGEKVEFGR